MTTNTETAPVTTFGGAAAPDVKPAAADVKPADGVKPTDVAPAAGEAEKAAAAALEAANKPFTDLAQLKLAEGVKLDDAVMKDFLPIAKEHGLTAKQAQALVEFDAKRAAAMETARATAKEAATKSAVELLKKDPEIGGANWEKSRALATKALTYIASPELAAAFDSIELADGSMLGDNLIIGKFLVSLGKKVSEDGTKGSHTNGAPPKKEKTLAEHLYGPGTVIAGPPVS